MVTIAPTNERLETPPDAATKLEQQLLQARVWEPAAQSMIEQIGVGREWKCADLGCGPAGVLRPLARAAGAGGIVMGIDNDAATIETARKFATAHRLRNVTLLQADAYDSGLPRESFDLVHARFLLASSGHDATLLREMIALARPGAVIAAQEPDSSSWNCYPRRAGWDALKPAILRAFRSNGGDFDAGTRLYGMMRQAGLDDIQVRTHVLSLVPGDPYRRVGVQFAQSLRHRILERVLLTASQLDAAIADCERAAADLATMFTSFTLVQAWGRKPG